LFAHIVDIFRLLHDISFFSLEEMLLNIGVMRWMVPVLAIELSTDHKPSHREMTSQLISELY
jgi:hypothetical protein